MHCGDYFELPLQTARAAFQGNKTAHPPGRAHFLFEVFVLLAACTRVLGNDVSRSDNNALPVSKEIMEDNVCCILYMFRKVHRNTLPVKEQKDY